MSLIIKQNDDDADELRKLEGQDVQQETDALTYVEFRLGYYDGLYDDDNGYEADTRTDDEESDEEPDTTVFDAGGEVSVDDVLGPGAQAAYDRRRELEDAGLVKKDTRRPGERCE
jgi:hypothetical protein